MRWEGKAYEAAAATTLPEVTPEESEGLHNVVRLSERIISGSEPQGESALRTLAAMGVKTILSVDGKAPDGEEAARFGMKYVHVPIQYKGISPDELARIAKTFRELEGPFFVHCFHGKHRGPAAAAVGRVVLDGAPREQAIAEMRQWCGTSPKYEGLFATIAGGEMPGTAATAAYAFDFPAAAPLGGIAGTMAHIARAYDNLEAVGKRAWTVDPDHPDVDPWNEAEKMARAMAHVHGLDDVARRPPDFRGWLKDSADASADLVGALAALRKGDAAGKGRADRSFGVLKERCDSCHAKYRN
jgi:protein tyrosine phosphatase (PTP) superfamily phosphohydrolase (DUF442 family)